MKPRQRSYSSVVEQGPLKAFVASSILAGSIPHIPRQTNVARNDRLTIDSEGKEKTRSFSVDLLATVDNHTLWSSTNNDRRPVWMTYAGSEQETKMFNINFLQGNKAYKGYHNKERFHLLKTAGYKAHTKKVGSDVVTTVYLPHLFWVDPGMVDPEKIEFMLLMSTKWALSQKFDLKAAREWITGKVWMRPADLNMTDADLTVILAEAVLFHMYLDRRSRYPMPTHPHFSLALMKACISAGLAERAAHRHTYTESGLTQLGIPPTLALTASHEHFGDVLAKEVSLWHA